MSPAEVKDTGSPSKLTRDTETRKVDRTGGTVRVEFHGKSGRRDQGF